jgi:hypothetical protein
MFLSPDLSLERILTEPHVAIGYHTREHGFSAPSAFVLAQGIAAVDLTPSREKLRGTATSRRALRGQCSAWSTLGQALARVLL